VHRTFSDFDDFWMTKVKVPTLGATVAAMASGDVETLKSRVRARAYRRHRRTDHARSLEYCCLMRDFTEDDATMQERFTVPGAALEMGNATSAKVFEAQSSLSWRPSSQIRPDGLMRGTGNAWLRAVIAPHF